MKRLFALLAGGLGLGALLRRRRPLATPADDLRLKLAEARSATPEPPAAPAPVEAPVAEEPAEAVEHADVEAVEDAEAPDLEVDVAQRRADVHERARRAMDELQ
jgi:hypothetical protein